MKNLILCGVLIAVVAMGHATQAATFAVDRTDDVTTGTCSAAANDCSLRGAIMAANALAGTDTVSLQSAAAYTLSLGPADSTPGSLVAASGDLDITDALVIDGNSATVSGGDIDRVFDIGNAGGTSFAVTINQLVITGGHPTGFLSYGGGLNVRGAALTLNSCRIFGNTTLEGSVYDNGGGISVNSLLPNTPASLSLTDCTVSGNHGQNGGGIVLGGSSNATILRSTIDNNTGHGAVGGGGLFVAGFAATATIDNSTVSLNTATINGGGLYLYNGSATISQATMALNNAAQGGGALPQGGTVDSSTGGGVLTSKLGLWANSAATHPDISGTVGSQGYNLFQSATGTLGAVASDLVNLNPLLGALADNGGPTFTHALLPGSPAINTGDPAFSGLSTDQRGQARKQGGRVDIGAYESDNALPTSLDLSNASVAENAVKYTSIGTLSTTDADAGDTFTYKLVAGVGSTDNALFTHTGNVLKTAAVFNYEVKNSYKIRVRTTDADGAFFEQQFTITVTDTNDAPVLDASGDPQISVNATGTSITALLATGANGAPISDEDAGPNKQGIAIFSANTSSGHWQYSLNNGSTWNDLGSVASSLARLLAADGVNTRLRFLANSSAAAAPLADALRFVAWDQTAGVNGDLGDVSNGKRGGKTAFSVAYESLKLLAPGAAAPILTITAPTKGTFAVAPTQATGTASAAAGVLEVRCIYLYRSNEGGNAPGYWNGSLSTPMFGAYSKANEKLANSSDGYANWTLALPALSQGQYALRMGVTDGYGQTRVKDVIFSVNDGLTKVSITSPKTGTIYTSGDLTQATGTASDADGIAGVTVYLYRTDAGGNTAGYWNGDVANPQFAPAYNASLNERPATSTATGGADAYATWSLALPSLGAGTYLLRATARDTKGNYSSANGGATSTISAASVDGRAITSTPSAGAISFSIAGSQTTPAAKVTAVASPSSSSVSLSFGGVVPAGDFAVTVNGTSVKVQSAQRVGQTVSLLLAEGALKAGDKVGVSWHGGAASTVAE